MTRSAQSTKTALTTIGVAVLVRALLTAAPAAAAEYTIKPITNADGQVTACQAINPITGIVFMAAGDRVLLFASSTSFHTAESDTVKGTWSVDGSTPADFTSEGGGENMVAFDVPNSADAVATLTSGKKLKISAKGVVATYDLSGTDEAFTGLIKCLGGT